MQVFPPFSSSSSYVPGIALLIISLSFAYSFLPLSPLAAFSLFKSSAFSSPPPSINNTSHKSIITHRYGTLATSSVYFRNAPWKAHVGEWLSRCYNSSVSLPIEETISNRPCPNGCSQQGVCNHADGSCRCFHGFDGPDCRKMLNLECNLEASAEWPYGRWVVSICSGYCDKRRAMCFCGAGTKYPDRPVAEACGFAVNGTLVDWAKPDWDNIFTNQSEKHGWCNVDPVDGVRRKVNFKEQCDCKYDCTSGRFCEIATQCVCINQCSGNGFCKGGVCQCKQGWYGVDCSIPAPQVAPKDWPAWLWSKKPPTSEGNKSLDDERPLHDKVAIVQKRRPLIYVYDLPPTFNSHLLEGRHWKYECVNRIYDQDNNTSWTPQLYGAEIALYESLLNSPHRTTNGEEADFFYVPVLGACLITRADDAPHLSMKNFMGFRSYTTLDFYRQAYFHISRTYAYWNRTSGRDHIWFFGWDEGACFAPKEIWNSMMLVHWGNTNSKHNYSTTGYFADNWDHIPVMERGNHVCFDPKKDIVLPAWKIPDPGLIRTRLWERPRNKRKFLFYFNGNLGNAYEYGRPEESYSMGIRQKLAQEFGSSPNKAGLLGKQSSEDVVVTHVRSFAYGDELASSKFCGVLPGDGWSGRMEDSILHGCIPVIIQDGIQLIYENVLDYEEFAVRVKEEDIPQLANILRAVNETQLESKLSALQKVWQRFLYRDAILLEAQRQQKHFGKTSEWATEYATLVDDDALSTFIQALHYKLYNDAWRLQVSGEREKRRSSLRESCH